MRLDDAALDNVRGWHEHTYTMCEHKLGHNTDAWDRDLHKLVGRCFLPNEVKGCCATCKKLPGREPKTLFVFSLNIQLYSYAEEAARQEILEEISAYLRHKKLNPHNLRLVRTEEPLSVTARTIFISDAEQVHLKP